MPALFPLVAWLLVAPTLAAPVQSTEPSAPAEPKARTTVLHLANGAVLRTRAREQADGWEVFSSGEWKHLPTEFVVRARNERELLDEAAKLERALPKDDPTRRVAYADWLVTEGLYVESLKQLDRVLARDPDQADALLLLARANLPLALPPTPSAETELEAFFAGAARLTDTGREVAVQRLKAAPEIPGLRKAVSGELLARTPGRRAFATLVLRRMFTGAEPEGLISRAVLDASSEVRVGAARALRAFDNPSVIAPAVRAIGSKHAEVRSNAIEALSAMEYREAVEPLYLHLVALQSSGGNAAPHAFIFTGRQRAYVQDFDVEVAQNAAIADPIINIFTEGQVLDAAVIAVDEYVVAAERAVVRRALAKLTGANPGDTTVAWQKWWKEHGDEWRAGQPSPKAPTSPAGQG